MTAPHVHVFFFSKNVYKNVSVDHGGRPEIDLKPN